MKHFSFRGFSLALRFLTILLCLIAFVPGAIPTALAQSNRTSLQPAATTSLGFHISGRFVLDANGNNFIMRGINVPHNWYPEQTSQFQHVKAKGANTVRVVLSSGQLWPKNSASDVANVINLCKTNKLVCVLEVHDTTGYGESAGAVSLAQAVAYWKEIKSVLIGQEAYVIINIGNEPYGNINATGWINDTKNAIAEMRTAGFQHMLMVDGPDWGQDWEFIMRDNAASVFNSDPNRNILFSIHMYGIFNTASKIQSYLSTFVNAGLPIAVGEFGHEHSDGNPDEDSIFSITQANGIGYLGWMWSGGSGAGTLDMVTNFNPNQETWWGTRIIHGPNGIAATSQEASIYSGISPTVYTVSGNVETRGITLSTNDGTIETALSDANGNYFITVPAGWSGTVTPSHECFTFPLPSRTYTNVTSDMPNQNYTPGFNPSSGCAEVAVTIANNNLTTFALPPGTSMREGYAGVNNGPARINSTNIVNILAALRVIWKEPGSRFSYSEMIGLPDEQLSSEYWFPWYNNAATNSMDQGLRIANVNTLADNTVEVWVGATTKLDTITLGAGESVRVNYNVDNGPLRVFCTTCSNTLYDQVITTLRVIWKEPGFRASYSEMLGLPSGQLSDEYWFPWYNNAVPTSMDQGFRIANISASEANTVEVRLGNTLLDTINLGIRESIRVGYNVDNGPIRIVCTTCSSAVDDKILAALRVIWKEPGFRSSYSEMMGLPKEQLSNEYWFPWYNNAATNSMDQGFRIANVDINASNTVEVWVGSTKLQTISLAAGGSTRVGYNVDNGPVHIVCTTCGTDNDKIIAALRVIWTEPGYRSSYSEMMGLPAEQLSQQYWFPWYNNADTNSMDQGFRIAVP